MIEKSFLEYSIFLDGINIIEKVNNQGKYTKEQKNILYKFLKNCINDDYVQIIKLTIETHPYSNLPTVGEILNNAKQYKNNDYITKALNIRRQILQMVKNPNYTYILDEALTKLFIKYLGGLQELGTKSTKELEILFTQYLKSFCECMEYKTYDKTDIIYNRIEDGKSIYFLGDKNKIKELLNFKTNLKVEELKILGYYNININNLIKTPKNEK